MIGNVIQNRFITQADYPVGVGPVVHPHGRRSWSRSPIYARVLGTEQLTG